MCARLDTYLDLFSDLRNLPYHSPILLLSILDAIAAGTITRNFIEISDDLESKFQSYLIQLGAEDKPKSMAQTFYEMGVSEFWHLRPKSGVTLHKKIHLSSIREVKSYFHGACFSEDLFPLLQMPGLRQKLRDVLITSSFPPELQEKLVAGLPE